MNSRKSPEFLWRALVPNEVAFRELDSVRTGAAGAGRDDDGRVAVPPVLRADEDQRVEIGARGDGELASPSNSREFPPGPILAPGE